MRASFHSGIGSWSLWVCVVLGCSGTPPAPAGNSANVSGGAGGSAGVNVAGNPGVAGGSAGSSGGTSGAGGSAGSAMPAAGAGGAAPQPVAGSAAGAGGAGGVAGAEAGAGGGSPTRSTGPGDWGPGDYPPGLMEPTYLEITGVPGQGSNARQYKVHVPPSYDPNVPAPLVFCIHGLLQDPVMFCVVGAAWHTKSDAAGFVLVMPNGYQNSWNGGTCCGAASSEQLDDVALFRALLEEVGKHVNVDLDRVYATGLSNGGFMSFRLACEAADIFTAVAPGAGAIGKNDIGGGTNPMSDFTTCEPSRPISVLAMHGTEDFLVPYSLHAPSLSHLAMKNGCTAMTRPASQPTSGGDTKCISYDGCPADIQLTGCTIDAGGHCWFGSPDCGTGGGDIGTAVVGANSDTMRNTDAAWDFFKGLSR